MTTFFKLKTEHVALGGSIVNQPCLGKSGTEGSFSGDLGGELESMQPLQAGDLALCLAPPPPLPAVCPRAVILPLLS